MDNSTPLTSTRLPRMLAGMALAVALLPALPADAQTGRRDTALAPAATMGEAGETGTIPAARPGLPQMPRGAEGPVRGDEPASKADPSIRDSHPLTVNGLWETLPGNVIAKPVPAQ